MLTIWSKKLQKGYTFQSNLREQAFQVTTFFTSIAQLYSSVWILRSCVALCPYQGTNWTVRSNPKKSIHIILNFSTGMPYILMLTAANLTTLASRRSHCRVPVNSSQPKIEWWVDRFVEQSCDELNVLYEATSQLVTQSSRHTVILSHS